MLSLIHLFHTHLLRACHAQGINIEKMQEVTTICLGRQIIQVSKVQETGGIDYLWMKGIGIKFASTKIMVNFQRKKRGA